MSIRRLNLVLDLDTGRYSGRIRQAGADMQRFGGQVKSSSADVARLGNSFDGLNNKLKTPLDKLRDYVLILGNIRMAIINVRDIAVGWVAGLIKQSAEVERLTVLMTGLSNASTEVGRNQEAQRNLKALFDMSRQTGYAVKELTDSFVKFKAGGLDPTDGSLKSLVNATARFGGTSDTMNRAAIAIQQMAGKGVISLEELRQQLGEAVPTAIRDMARGMGMSTSALVDEISKGKVQAMPALKALFDEWERMYAGSAERMSQTLNGQLATLRTNIMQRATDFTNLSAGMTPVLQAEADNAKKLLDEQKITAEQFRQINERIQADAQKNADGVYGSTVSGLKELNQALESNEMRVFVAEVGAGVNSIMTGLTSVVRHIVHFRNEYGVAMKVILSGMAVLMGANFLRWMVAQFAQLGSVWATTRTQMASLGMAYGQLTGQSLLYANAKTREALQSAAAVNARRAELSQARENVAAKTAEIARLRDVRASYEQMIPVLQRHEQLSRRQADIARAGGKARDFETGQFISNSRAIQINENHRKALMRTNAAAATNQRALTAAIAASDVALKSETVAAAAADVAVKRHAAAHTLSAVAVRAGTVALGFFRAAMGLLLGPVGAVIMVIATLCAQLGLFTTRAQQARQAADSLRQGLVDLAAVEALKARNKELRAQNEADEKLMRGERTSTYDPRMGLGGNVGRWIGDKVLPVSEAEKKAAAKRKADRDKEIASNDGAMRTGYRSARDQSVQNRIVDSNERVSVAEGQATRKYGQDVRAIEGKYAPGTPEYNRRMEAARNQRDGTIGNAQNAELARLRANMLKPGQSKAQLDIATRAYKEFEAGMTGAGSAAVATAAEVAGLGNAVGGAGSKASKAETQLGNAAVSVAGLAAKAQGSGKYLAEFNAKIAEGQLKGWSQTQIERGRVLAMQKDALTDAAKAAGDAKQANESFDNTLASVAGQIAEMTAELNGGQGELAKFNAELAAGKYDGVTEDRIEQMRRYLQVVEKLKDDVDWDKATRRMTRELSRQTAGADALWASWARGTVEADQRMNDLRERYGDVLEIAERAAAAGDPTRMAAFNQLMEQLATNDARRNAVEVMDEWRLASEEMRIGLMQEDEARLANFEREMERQRALIDWTRLNTEERIAAERRLAEYRSAAEARTARERESSITRQARQWAQLGQNIDQALSGALNNFVDGMAEGNLNFADFTKSIIKELIKIILKAMIAYAILSAIGAVPTGADGQKMSMGQFMKQGISQGFNGGPGGFDGTSGLSKGVTVNNGMSLADKFGGGGGIKTPGYGGGMIGVGTRHTGGIIGAGPAAFVNSSIFAMAKKYHGGGWIGGRQLKSGEVPIVGLEKELVLTERQQQLLGQRLGSSGGGAPPAVSINIINNSGTQLEAEQGEPEFNGKDMIVNVVVEAAQKQGPLRDVLSQVAKGG